MIVSGSIVRGEAGPTSDLDIVVVHREPWRVRDQKRFNGVPAELFVNPPDRIRSYFANEHRDGRPCTAHMLVTGEIVDGDDVVHALVREAHEWLAKPIAFTEAELAAKRYFIVDSLDDARDAHDAASVALLVAEAVRNTVAYAFLARGLQQPRRKSLVHELSAIDSIAADHLRAFAASRGIEDAIALARHVIGADTFFEWTSDRS
jgi:hypothetical protein